MKTVRNLHLLRVGGLILCISMAFTPLADPFNAYRLNMDSEAWKVTMYGSVWKTVDHSHNIYTECPVNHFSYVHSRYYHFPSRYAEYSIYRFNYSRFSSTECFLCKYFKGPFHWTQKIFFVGQMGQPDNRKNAARAYRSKTLGEGLEQIRQWKTLMRVNQKEFDPTGITYPPRFRIPFAGEVF